MAKEPSNDVSIGKFDNLATYVYTQALLQGLDDAEAKQRGMVAAIMGAQARLGVRFIPSATSELPPAAPWHHFRRDRAAAVLAR
jgi:methyl coenzyme M reductase gamma subunit